MRQNPRPLIGHLQDGLKIFHNAMWAGYYHMYFKNGEFELPGTAMISVDIKDAWYTNLPGKGPHVSDRRDHLIVSFFKKMPDALRVESNTDDHPTFEYYWLRKLLGLWISPQTALWDIDLKAYSCKIPVYE